MKLAKGATEDSYGTVLHVKNTIVTLNTFWRSESIWERFIFVIVTSPNQLGFFIMTTKCAFGLYGYETPYTRGWLAVYYSYDLTSAQTHCELDARTIKSWQSFATFCFTTKYD